MEKEVKFENTCVLKGSTKSNTDFYTILYIFNFSARMYRTVLLEEQLVSLHILP